MDGQGIFAWVDFYQEFADTLLQYKNNRQELIAKVRLIFHRTGIKLPTLDKDNQIYDLDPFTVFGLFNKSRMKESNRIKIVRACAELFDVKAEVPTRFDSIPVLFPMNATFYNFIGDRGDNDIDTLWELFDAALAYSHDGGGRDRLCKYFDQAIKLPGVGNSKLTMGLYWIAPNTYLNLDKRNIWYIYQSGKMPSDFVASLPNIGGSLNAQLYLEVTEKVKSFLESSESAFKSLQDLSQEAWRYSEEVNLSGDGWEPVDYEPGITTEMWLDLLQNESVFTKDRLTTIKCFFDYGTPATCSQLAQKYGRNANYYNVGGSSLAKAVAKELQLNPVEMESGRTSWWPIVFLGREAGKGDKGVFIWKLRDELFEAIKQSDLSHIELVDSNGNNNGLGDAEIRDTHYWLYAPGRGAEMWEQFYKDGIMALGWNEMGNLIGLSSKTEIAQKMGEVYGDESSHKNDALTLWQFYNDIQPGDIVFVKKGMKAIIGMGKVESEYQYDEDAGEFPHFRRVNWSDKGHWKYDSTLAMKTLTDVTKYTELIESVTAKIIESRDSGETPPVTPPIDPVIINRKPPYTADDFLKDVFMDKHSYETLASLIRTKKNVILQGAPGVGKTFAAKRLAYSMMGEKDTDRVMMVQFHQSYSYEDFIMGFRPSEKGFELKHGAFYTFCKKAEEDSDNEYFFIIDEINRGNLSKIFGELFMLIESDKRNIELRLLYANEKFSVPANVYIIGMMNTADRSLAMLDYALRRRFAFFEMKPGFETDGFRAYRMALHSERFNRLIQCVENLNNVIATDESLGEGFCIGHSYFCNLKEADEQTLSNIVEFELIPLLKEYWFDEPTKVKDWTNMLRSAIK